MQTRAKIFQETVLTVLFPTPHYTNWVDAFCFMTCTKKIKSLRGSLK